jgi:hypothetical protein
VAEDQQRAKDQDREIQKQLKTLRIAHVEARYRNKPAEGERQPATNEEDADGIL